MTTNTHTPTVLIILDGWGIEAQAEHNPTVNTHTPTLDRLYREQPHISLDASGHAVGLPANQMGNSEVGHLHLGAGRKVPQELTRIDAAIETGSFFQHTALNDAITAAKTHHSAIHILGLLSDGGVHSHAHHIQALMTHLVAHGVDHTYLHAILDGRDTPPQSAQAPLAAINALCQGTAAKIASITGRYYAMDRDERYDRTEQAYLLLTEGKAASSAATVETALAASYAQGITDEFVLPTAIVPHGSTPITIKDNDVVIFMNFRADRARQLSAALFNADFTGFARNTTPQLSWRITLTEYASSLNATALFPAQTLNNTLGEWLSSHNRTQLRLAETEKYAHVTYFFNGGIEAPWPGESRQLIPSPKVATYDLQPAMSAPELTDALVKALAQRSFDFIVCNFANPDMVGHTGDEQAAETAVRTIDHCIERIVTALEKVNGQALITADHGNIECMYDAQHQQPHTAHTTNPVPLIYIGRKAVFIKAHGALDDVAPTLLRMMEMDVPHEMTGTSLLSFDE